MSAPVSRTAASERGGHAPPACLTFHCFLCSSGSRAASRRSPSPSLSCWDGCVSQSQRAADINQAHLTRRLTYCFR